MSRAKQYKILTYFFSIVWLINGLFFKVLNLLPRHEWIVARILSEEYAHQLTIMIGIGELVIAQWIFEGNPSRLRAQIQIGLVGIMNIIEAIMAPDLLMFGYGNMFFALIFMVMIYYHEYVLGASLEETT